MGAGHDLDSSCRLWLSAATLAAPLPEMRPGALPALDSLILDFRELRTTLPVSWGSSTSVLSSLQELLVTVQAVGPLPPEWSEGFKRLANMGISRLPPGLIQKGNRDIVREAMAAQLRQARATSRDGHPTTQPPAPSAAALEAARLPPSWATGLWNLRSLTLNNLGITGPIPHAWQTRGFPALNSL